jgi:hypothetical protein
VQHLETVFGGLFVADLSAECFVAAPESGAVRIELPALFSKLRVGSSGARGRIFEYRDQWNPHVPRLIESYAVRVPALLTRL